MKKNHGTTNKTSPGIVFSSGFFGFFAHAGFLAALRELGISGSAYGGSSSGAIVAAMAASGMKDQAIKEMLFSIKKKDFWDPDSWPFLLKNVLILFRGYSGYLNGRGFSRLLGKLPVQRIEECSTPLAVTAINLTLKQATVFTEGDLIKTLHASGAVPMLFKPVEIDGSLYVDGGVADKAPLKAVAALGDTNRMIVHFISSDNVGKGKKDFVEKRMTPFHVQHLAVNIAREEAYEKQLELVKASGVDVVEVRTNTPSVSPDRLDKGPKAYWAARTATLKILENYA